MAKEDTQHLVTRPKINTLRSKKKIKICAAIAACVTFVVGTYIVLTRNDSSVTERESDNQEISLRNRRLDATIPFEAIPGETCGVHFNPQQNSSSNRVIGGDPSILGMFRWQASFKDGYCGASIISDRWLLTAAHCITSDDISNPESSYVRVGSLSKIEGGVKHYLERVIKNEGYDDDFVRTGNDVALLKTRTVITFNDYVHPICLPSSDLCLSAGSEMWVSGYGISNEIDENAMFFGKTFLSTFDDCMATYPGLSESVTCVRATSTACNGDSGGPLSTRINQVWYNYGSVSFGKVFCPTNEYSGFSRTTYFINWILENTEGDIIADYAGQDDEITGCLDTGSRRSDEGVWDDLIVPTNWDEFGDVVDIKVEDGRFTIKSQVASNYEPSIKKQWKIESTNGENFNLWFDYMDIEASSLSCPYDRVKIIINDEDNDDLWCARGGQESSGDDLQEGKDSDYADHLEGSRRTEDILDLVFTGKSIRVLFETDSSLQYDGFKFTVDSDTTLTTVPPSATTKQTTSSVPNTTIEQTTAPVTSGTTSTQPPVPDRWELTDENNRIYVSQFLGDKTTCLQLKVTSEGYKQVETTNCKQYPGNSTQVNLQWRMFWTNNETFQIKPLGVPGIDDSFCLGVSTVSPYEDDVIPCRYTDGTSWSFDYLENGHLYNPFYRICLMALSNGRASSLGRVTFGDCNGRKFGMIDEEENVRSWNLIDEDNRIYAYDNVNKKEFCLGIQSFPRTIVQAANCTRIDKSNLSYQWRKFVSFNSTLSTKFKIQTMEQESDGSLKDLCLSKSEDFFEPNNILGPCSNATEWSIDVFGDNYLTDGKLKDSANRACLNWPQNWWSGGPVAFGDCNDRLFGAVNGVF